MGDSLWNKGENEQNYGTSKLNGQCVTKQRHSDVCRNTTNNNRLPAAELAVRG